MQKKYSMLWNASEMGGGVMFWKPVQVYSGLVVSGLLKLSITKLWPDG